MHERFAEQARRDAGPAGGRRRRRDLDLRRARGAGGRLARRLRARGSGRGDVVAILAAPERAAGPALLGVLEAGAAFLVLDPAYPGARLASCLRLAQPAALLESSAAGPVSPSLAGGPLGRCRVGRQAAAAGAGPASPGAGRPRLRRLHLRLDRRAQGDPGHATARSPTSCAWHAATFGLGADDRFSLLSGLAHDPLLRDVFTPLCARRRRSASPTRTTWQPGRLAAWMARQRVTVAHLTPALGQLLDRAAGDGRCRTCARPSSAATC